MVFILGQSARTGNLQRDIFLLIPGAAQGAVLCLQHYLRLPTLLPLGGTI